MIKLIDYKIWGYDFECYSKINWWCCTFIEYENPDNIITIVNNRGELLEFYDKYKNDVFKPEKLKSYAGSLASENLKTSAFPSWANLSIIGPPG